MPSNTTITLTASVWTQITAGDVTALRVQNQGGYEVRLKATVGAVPPTDSAGALILQPYAAISADYALSSIWPGVAGANRVYALCDAPVSVSVSHA